MFASLAVPAFQFRLPVHLLAQHFLAAVVFVVRSVVLTAEILLHLLCFHVVFCEYISYDDRLPGHYQMIRLHTTKKLTGFFVCLLRFSYMRPYIWIEHESSQRIDD